MGVGGTLLTRGRVRDCWTGEAEALGSRRLPRRLHRQILRGSEGRGAGREMPLDSERTAGQPTDLAPHALGSLSRVEEKMDTCRGAGVCAEPEASTPFRADVSLAVFHSPAAAESPGLGKTDFSVPQFQETLNANLCLLKGLFEKMEHIILRHDSSGAGRWRVGMGERGAHGMLGFEKASCNMNALVAGGGGPIGWWELDKGREAREERGHLFIHPTNAYRGPAMCHVLSRPPGIQ